MPFTQKQAECWEKTRLKGKRRFIWLFGVCLWGLSMSVLMSLFQWYFYDHLPSPAVGFIAQFLLWPVGGYLWGLLMWNWGEKQYQQYQQSKTSDAAIAEQPRSALGLLRKYWWVGAAILWLFMAYHVATNLYYKKNPPPLTKDEIEVILKEKSKKMVGLDFIRVSLNEDSPGVFTGTGEQADGTPFTIKVTRRGPRKLDVEGSNEKGMSFGFHDF